MPFLAAIPAITSAATAATTMASAAKPPSGPQANDPAAII